MVPHTIPRIPGAHARDCAPPLSGGGTLWHDSNARASYQLCFVIPMPSTGIAADTFVKLDEVP